MIAAPALIFEYYSYVLMPNKAISLICLVDKLG